MIDERQVLERALQCFPAEPGIVERVNRRRDRKRRNKRIGTVALAVGVSLAAIGGVIRVFGAGPGSQIAPPGTTWSEVPSDGGAFEHHYLEAVTVWNGVYVAVGESTQGPSVVLTSSDAVHWTGTSELGPSAVAWDIISAGPRLMVVGNDGDGAAVWVSDDATTWTRATVSGDVSGSFWGVMTGGPGYIGVGTTGNDGSDGAIWTSADGLEWTPVPDESVFAGPGDQWVGAIAPGGPGFVAAGWDRPGPDVSSGSAAVWTSADGISWTRVLGQTTLESGGFTSMDDLVQTETGLLGVGTVDGSFRPEVFTAAVWTSSDGLIWAMPNGNESTFASAGEMLDVTRDGPGFVAVGVTIVPHGSTTGAMWTSSDGDTWAQLPGELFSPRGGGRVFINSVADGPAGLVAVGEEISLAPDGSKDVVGRVWTTAQVTTSGTTSSR